MKKTRKNLFTYSLNPLFHKKKGFTLAEVLIVIGVIGVVAALTIPTLIKNHQKRVWVEQLRTSVVKIQDGFRLAMAEDGVDDLGETELWSMIPADADVEYGIDPTNLKEYGKPFIDRLSQYIKIASVQDSNEFEYSVKTLNTYESENIGGAIQLLNGAMIVYPMFYKTDFANQNENVNKGCEIQKEYGAIFIDVNGPKVPNQLGRDVFYFILAQNGLLYPAAGKDNTIFAGYTTLEDYKTNSIYWNQNGTNNGDHNCSTKLPSLGLGCAARIIEEGWKMNY